MAHISRQELKSDEFVSGVDAAFEFYLEHQKQILTLLVVVVVVVASGYGFYAWNHQRNQKAASLLSSALDTLHAPIAPNAQNAPAGVTTYPSDQARAQAAAAQFQQVVGKYGSTESGKVARYYLGLAQEDLNEPKQAEATLKQAMSEGGNTVAALARNALANLYLASGKESEARSMLQQLITADSPAVPRAVAMTELAQLEAGSDPAAAAKLYRQLSAEYPNTETAQAAQQALAKLPAATQK